ncbi:hypothetical protein SEA_MARIETTA_74 [Gordonia phage Marietta]|uniref:Uncharacterized protein n=2 Tax=Sukkupivirus TaxID=2948917 RepID=A0A385DPN0_9CAUD|nr:hypothetical protein KNU07_gp74 [Gordonia phage Marietta]YP_010104652.1 hypothetical protein KNU78_gp73 [Gordonia phage Sukkupi]QAU06399.1 hypothetical protein SEA_WHOSEMANZ_73 [Gordonia phage WhoseManz]QAU07123.1 hypothetical protein SEA_BIPAUNETO_76 [Gordonia phage BiPauneto]QGH80789.1 hypothetical protein SEA_YNDEXA_73 [Gordonia phage Yndexa]AXQ61393.1 hypothetical protein SEA_MARIETTA_74 [Gordonia phage Marietta]QGH79316.1 hypothetical protein SEA_SUKKUPI_73 [Gordonia phage Sukkupi]
MQEYIVEVEQITTTTFSIMATDENEAIERHADIGVAIHSESHTSTPRVVSVGGQKVAGE